MPEVERWPASHLLSTAARMFERAVTRNLDPIGITHPEAIALQILAGMGPCTQSELAEASGVRAQSLGSTLSKLQARSCVDLQRVGRVQLVTMTRHGVEVLERVNEAEREGLAHVLLDGRFCEELQVLVRTLAKDEAATVNRLSAG
ncbi:MarR family winged helix-turn-helix transcriptional regulator (plasmid) [Arthrobacter sp. D3-18]